MSPATAITRACRHSVRLVSFHTICWSLRLKTVRRLPCQSRRCTASEDYGNCSSCHTQQGWTPATFDHDKYFRFDREHTTECTTCHINDDYSNYTCYGCHEHSCSKIREEHVEEGIFDYENCSECHRSGDEDEAEYLWKRKRMEQGKPDRGARIVTIASMERDASTMTTISHPIHSRSA